MANEQSANLSWFRMLIWSLKLDVELLFHVQAIPLLSKVRFILLKYVTYLKNSVWHCQERSFSLRVANKQFHYRDPNGLASLQRVYCGSHTLKKLVPEKATIIDVGANIGQFNHFSSCYLGAERIVSIEPEKESYELLKLNADDPGDCLNVAVSCLEEDVTLYVAKLTSQLSSYVPDERIEYSEKYRIPTQSLDTIVKDLDIEHVDLLKIDTEGSEFDVLKSAEDVLQKTDLILIEMSVFRESAGNLFQTGSFLEERGFSLVELSFGSSSMPRDVDALFKKL